MAASPIMGTARTVDRTSACTGSRVSLRRSAGEWCLWMSRYCMFCRHPSAASSAVGSEFQMADRFGDDHNSHAAFGTRCQRGAERTHRCRRRSPSDAPKPQLYSALVCLLHHVLCIRRMRSVATTAPSRTISKRLQAIGMIPIRT